MLRSNAVYLCIAMAAWAVVATAGERLQSPDSSATIPVRDKLVGKFQNGFLVTSDVPGEGISQVYAYNRSGAQTMQVKLAFSGASRVDVHDFTVSPGGIIGVSGVAYTSDGAYSTFLAWISADGKIQRVVRVSPFSPRRLSFASDGSLWVAGTAQTPARLEDPSYDVLRRYDSTGHLLGSSLPRSSFSMSTLSHRSPAANAFLVPLPDRMGFYSPSEQTWIEVGAAGPVILRTAAMDAGVFGAASSRGKVRVTGAAALASGRAYISTVAPDGSGKDQPAIYRVDTSTPNWQRVDASAVLPPGRNGWIAGADGERLVIMNGAGQVWWAGIQ
ncbi:MAG TPA: hypothetical protein VFW83_08005 [Bryobacteraceae bacterium]|nr:hypothetical protein [Bryobacteraceae bacterium]